MKQTNNAIKFLMAQYRAIFKNAYFKGLTTALVLTAGLAAGQAQAATVTNIADATSYDSPYDSTTPITDKVVIGGTDGNSGTYVINAVLGQGGVITNERENTASKSGTFYLNGTLTINGGRIDLTHITDQTAINNVGGIADWDGTSNNTNFDDSFKSGSGTSTIVLNDGSINVKHSSIQVGSFILNGGEVTLGGSGSYIETQHTAWGGSTGLAAATDGTNGGIFTANNTTINLNESSTINGYNLSFTNTEINFDGTTDVNKNGAAVIRGGAYNADLKSMTFGTGTVLNVAEGAFGAVIAGAGNTDAGTAYGQSTSFNSGAVVNIENDATFSIGLEVDRYTGALKDTADITAAPTFDFNNGSTVNNEGTFKLLANKGNVLAAAGAASGGVVTSINQGAVFNNTGADSVIQIEDGNKVLLNGGTVNNEGLIDIQAGAVLSATEQVYKSVNGQTDTDGIVNLGGQINVGGNLRVEAGSTLVLDDTAVLSTNSAVANEAGSEPASGLIHIIADDKKAGKLVVSADTLNSFLTAGQDALAGEGPDKAGAVFFFGAGTTIDFGTEATVNNFKFSDAVTAGHITIGAETNAVLTADTLNLTNIISGATNITNTKTDGYLVLEADSLKISADSAAVSAINAANGNLNFKDALVNSNLDIDYVGNNSLQLGDNYYLDAYTTDANGNYVAGNGTVTGKAFTVVSGGALNFRAGNWTAEPTITLKAGSGAAGTLDVSTQIDTGELISEGKTADADKLLTSTNVKLNNGLVLNLDASNSTTKNGPTVTVKNSAEADKKGLTATLDLTSGLSVALSTTTDNNADSGSITASGDGATVILAGANVTKILADSNNANLNKIALVAANGGTIEANAAVSANYGDFIGTTATAGKVQFDSYGTFYAPSLTLTGTATTEGTNTTLNIGEGTIKTDSLLLEETGANTVTGDTKTILADGYINVSSSLRAQSDILNVSGADVYLNTGNAAIAGALNINDLEITSGSFNVAQGEWNATTSNLTVNGGALTVGATDGDGASLTASRLTVGNAENTGVNVTSNGEVIVTTADLQNAGTGSINVGGQMTVVGAVIDMDGNANNKDTNHHGLYFGGNSNNAVFNVDGGHLTFGAEATKTFYDTALQESGTAVDSNDDGTTDYRLPYVDDNSMNKLSVANGGQVELTFAAGTSFNGEQILSLKEQLFSEIAEDGGAEKLDGFLNIGKATISGINPTSGSISWSELEPYTDIIWDVTNTELGNAKVTGVDYTSQIGGSFGSIEAANGTTAVTIASNTTLSNAAGNDGNFIDTVDGTVIGATVTNEQVLTFNGAGNVGNINLQAGSVDDETSAVFNATNSGDAILVNGTIAGAVDGHTAAVFDGEGTTTVQGNITVGSVGVAGNLVAQGDITSDEMWVDGSLTAEKSVTTNGIDAKNGATVSVAGDMTLGSSTTQGHAYADIEDSSKIAVAGDLTVYGGTIRVGSDDITHTQYVNAAQPDGSNPYNGYVDAADETADGQISNTASTGYLEVLGETRLNGATVFVDPTYGLGTSLATFATFADSSINHGQLGVLDGNIVVGKNAAVGLGLTNAELAERIAQFQTNGSLNEGLYGSILYVNGQVNVADGQYIAINGNANNKTVAQINTDFGNSTADLRLGSNTALIISDNAVQAAANSRDANRDAAISFNKTGATVYAQTDAAVLLDGTTFSLNDIKLFDDADGNGVTLTSEDGQGLYVGTVSGLFEAWMDDGEAGTIKLSITRNGLENTALSYPVKDSLYAVLGDTVKTETLPPTDIIPPANGEGSTEGNGGEAARVAGEPGTEGSTGEGAGTPEPTPVITEVNKYKLDQGSFLATALAEQASLQSVEQAARLGVYAGVAQSTLGATNTTTEAISGRMGVGAQSGTITYADNGQGAGLWLAPVYKNHSSDGFDAEGADYGVDMDLYGLALGADYTLANGVRIGAMFNVGSGDADGNGVASGVSNEFDYYGFGVYGGYTMGALSVVADVTYTAVDNDFDASTGLSSYGKLEGAADSDAFSLGITGQYEFATQSVTVTPHAGLRFTKVSIDDYTVKADGTEIADFSADDMNVFSIPVGVTFASEFTTGAWSVQPSLDVTLTANAGDTDLDGDSRWLGTDNGFGEMTYGVSTEVLDDFTYGATLGIAAKTGGFSLGLGVNYTGSSNTDEFGVNANARFVF